MKPQKLHPEILNRLKIQQSKVRYLPMHLHAREVSTALHSSDSVCLCVCVCVCAGGGEC